MKLNTNLYGEISIRWQYNMTNGDRDVTKVYMEQKNGKEWKIIKEISVVRKPSEKYDKELARKFALAKLIKQSFSEITKNEDGKIIYYRAPEYLEDRKNLWEAYKNRIPKKEN